MRDLADALTEKNCDAYVVYDSSENADMRYLAGFLTSDPYIYIYSKEGEGTVIVSSMEELRARRETTCNVVTRSAAGLPDLLKEYQDAEVATAHMIGNFAGKKLLVPSSMPVGFAQTLMSVADVIVDRGTVAGMRTVKSSDEIALIREVQKRNEEATRCAVDLIRKSEVGEDKGLIFEDEPVTSEKVRDVIAASLRPWKCEERDTIISCGTDTAMPHCLGTGQLYANQPIVMDVFPRSLANGYFADMARTISKGAPREEIVQMYAVVHEAKELAAEMLAPGISGADVHKAVVDFFAERGYVTAGSSGFIHSLGHGVGLEIHEGPSLSLAGGILEPGNVVTIEPGLYYPGVGGVRLEDMGVITENGFDRFTNFDEQLIV
ncbi:Xaa-Pro peptidase family protein [Methanorbis rubei]|uniref:Methionine aminopeptidase 1, mitochondrial n=1 Tax=Methanorbis rubei TaxID=3028300 RepID=A0AAE4MHZ5_9EURY|nr:Methionine aminopeptidase 1, mitochondrial [Methanocorpusculaceae archaeon Cs1]